MLLVEGDDCFGGFYRELHRLGNEKKLILFVLLPHWCDCIPFSAENTFRDSKGTFKQFYIGLLTSICVPQTTVLRSTVYNHEVLLGCVL